MEGSGWVQEKPELCPDLGFHLSGRRALFQIEQMFLWAGGHQGKCLAQAGPVKFSFSPRSMKVLDFETGEVWPGAGGKHKGVIGNQVEPQQSGPRAAGTHSKP